VAATITVGTNSWVTEAQADTYMAARIKGSDYWTDAASDNIPALITAYNWLMAGRFSLSASATAAQAIKDAQCEMALFLLQHQPDLDLRMGLQAQGVVAAGVVKEKYRNDGSIELPMPLIVQQLLSAYDTDSPIGLVTLERNEEEDADYNAWGNLLTDEAAD